MDKRSDRQADVHASALPRRSGGSRGPVGPRAPQGRTPLPDAVYRDLVDMLFSMTLPVVAMGAIYTCVGALIVWQWRDTAVAVLTIAAIAVTLFRWINLNAYWRRDPATMDLAAVRRWERRYAIGNYAFAALLGALNVRTLMFHLPLVHLIGVSLVFVFGAGIVSRIAIRPVICVTSLLLAVVPTTIALAAHAFTNDHSPLHVQLFAFEALLVAFTAVLSLQSVAHLHRSMVQHLTVKHDLSMLARHDALTDLPNRLMLRERFQEAIGAVAQGPGRSKSRLAVHCLDLDGFKQVNDIHGHPAGDAVLREAARRLAAAVRGGDTVARLGGDEFVVVQAGVTREDEAEMLARRIIRQLSLPYRINGGEGGGEGGMVEIRIAASVGIAMAPDRGLDLGQLIACADQALYQAKRAGKAQLRFCGAKGAGLGLRGVAA